MKYFRLLYFSLFILCLLAACSPDSEAQEEETEPEIIPDPVSNVSGFSPQKVDLGDTITIQGENFSRNFQLLLNEMPLRVVFNNDSVIKFEITYHNYNPFNFKVILNDNESDSKVFENPFQLFEPKIDSVSSKIGFKDKVTIYGSHLTNHPSRTRDIVYVNNEMFEAEYQSKDSIVFDLRFQYLDTHENDLLVQAQLQEIRLEKGLKIAPPEIEGIDKANIKVGDTLKIQGKYFLDWSTNQNKVYIDNIRAEILEATSENILIKMPMGPYEDRDITEVKVKLFDKVATQDIDLHLENTWYLSDVVKTEDITDSPYVGNIAMSSFAENDKFFINSFMRSNDDNFINDRISQYDPITKELVDLPRIPVTFENYTGGILQLYTSNNDLELFIYLSRDENNFFRYNYISGELTELADFPGPEISEATGAILDNSFYLGLGHTGNNSVFANREMYEYDISSNTWSLHSEMPFESDRAYNSRKTDFIWDNSLYTGNGSEWQYDFWKFSPADGWVRKKSIPNPISSEAYFKANNKAFYYHQYSNEFWEYNRTEDTWNNRSDLAIGKYRISVEFSFAIGDHVYLIGYFNDYGYEESPVGRRDQLILRTELSNL